MYKHLGFIFLMLSGLSGFCQTSGLTLDSCIQLARENYPIIHELDLIARTESYEVSNINSSWIPQFNFNAQSTYQSEVTHFDIKLPGINLPAPPTKQQNKLTLDVSQTLYDGGQIKAQKNIARSGSRIEMLKAETELYHINERVLQLFFGSLLIQKQLTSTDLLEADLQEQIKKSKAALDAKVIAANTLYSLQAEEIKNQQHKEELKAMQTQWLLMLGKFINKKLDTTTILITPPAPSLNSQLNRPEIKLYEAQSALFDYQSDSYSSLSIPHLGAFAQLGYANPGLNFLKEGFQTYYIAGLKLNWNISSLYTKSNGDHLTILNKSITNLQKETFQFNMQLNMIQQQEEIRKYEALIRSDDELVELRKKIKEAAKAQWENGVITVSDYLRELDAEEQARTNHSLHHILFLQSSYLHNYYSGN